MLIESVLPILQCGENEDDDDDDDDDDELQNVQVPLAEQPSTTISEEASPFTASLRSVKLSMEALKDMEAWCLRERERV